MDTKPHDPFHPGRLQRPWLVAKDGGVPWSMRTYAFNLKAGRVDILHEGFHHVLQPDGETVKVKKVAQSIQKYPEQILITIPDIEAIWAAAEAEDISLKVAFARFRGQSKLTEEQMDMLANAPNRWVYAPAGAQKVLEREEKKSVDEFKNAVFGKQPAKKPEPAHSL